MHAARWPWGLGSPLKVWTCGLVLSLMVGVLSGGVVHAQEPPRRGENTPLWELDEEELRKRQWEFAPEERQPGSAVGGLIALTGGLVFHGAGHLYVDDVDTMTKLLIMEGTGLSLVLAGFLTNVLSNDADTINPVWQTLVLSGVTVLASSYLFDVLGTFKGSTRSFEANQRQPRGIAPLLTTRLVPNDPFELNVIGGLEAPFYSRYFWVVPSALIEVNGAFWRVGGEAAARLWRAPQTQTYLALGTEFRYEAYEAFDFNVLLGLAFAEFGFDAGSLIDHIKGLMVVTRLGFGYEGYHWEALDPDEIVFRDRTSLLVWESEWSVNVAENINFAVYYQQRPDLLLGGVTRGLGIFGTRVQGYNDPFLVRIEANFGTIAELWVSLGFFFGPNDKP